jgi:hypothetical protein
MSWVPNNCEIIAHEGLKGKVLIPIPTTPFAILGAKRSHNSFDVSIISRVGNMKKDIQKGMNEDKFAILIMKTLAFRELRHFKKPKRWTQRLILNIYKTIIKEAK